MSENIANGIDFFKSVLEAPVYANTPSSDIIINPLDLEKFDSLSDSSDFDEEIYLVIGDSIESREVLRAKFSRSVTNNIITRTIVLLEPSENDYYSGTIIFCGSSIRYIQDVKEEISTIKEDFSDFVSSVEVSKREYDVVISDVADILDNADFSEASSSVKSLVVAAFDNNPSWGISSTENIFVYKVKNDCGQLRITFPKNDVEEDRVFILLNVEDLPVSSNMFINHVLFSGTGDNNFPHTLVLKGIFSEGILFDSFGSPAFGPFETIAKSSNFTDIKAVNILKDFVSGEKFAWPSMFFMGFENIIGGE